MTARRRLTLDSGTLGAGLCVLALVLLLSRSLLATAIGVELLAAAFWLWARADDHAAEQVPRWQWLRRPAMAVWIAFAVHAASPMLRHVLGEVAFRTHPLAWIEAAALVWAGLELVAALPLARPFSDFPGPYVSVRPWLPVVLPSAGFLLLWTHAEHWTGVATVCRIATILLVLTALLAALRAFARRGWTVSLRWLSVSHSALALVLLSEGSVAGEGAFLIWLGAFGGPAFVLAGELAGASPRRGAFSARLWRAASFVSTVSLGWPVLLALAPTPMTPLHAAGFVSVSVSLAISTWIMVGRLEVAPERRRLMRPGSGITASRVASVLVMLLGPIGLVIAWWAGFEPHWGPSLAAFAPMVIGAGLAVGKRRRRGPQLGPVLAMAGRVAKPLAGAAYRAIVGWERGVLRAVMATTRVALSPVRDLHTGDAQEYLLFLVGVGVLALLLPLLR